MKTKDLLLTLSAATLFLLSTGCNPDPKPEPDKEGGQMTFLLRPDVFNEQQPTLPMGIHLSGSGEMWVDANADGSMQTNEKYTGETPWQWFDITAQHLTIHGAVKHLMFGWTDFTTANYSQNPHLEQLDLTGGSPYLRTIDLSTNTKLRVLFLNELPALEQLKLTPNALLLEKFSIFNLSPGFVHTELERVIQAFPDRTGKLAGIFDYAGFTLSQEHLSLLKQKNWKAEERPPHPSNF